MGTGRETIRNIGNKIMRVSRNTEFMGHNKWELYNDENGDRERGNYGSMGNEGERKEHSPRKSLVSVDWR